MSKFAVARNVSDSPVTIDDDGRVLGGGEWAAVRHQTQLVRDHIDRGVLVVHPSLKDADDLDPQAREALADADESNQADQDDDKPAAANKARK